MPKFSRRELSLKRLREIVSDVYCRNGYEILSWLEGACPKRVKKLRESTLSDYQVLDLAIDAIMFETSREKKRESKHSIHNYKSRKPRRPKK